jgi:hypothetical protein
MFLVLIMFSVDYHLVMNLGKAGMFLAIGFIPTLIALEMVYRMGRAIAKLGEVSALVLQNRLTMHFACELGMSPLSSPQPTITMSISFL